MCKTIALPPLRTNPAVVKAKELRKHKPKLKSQREENFKIKAASLPRAGRAASSGAKGRGGLGRRGWEKDGGGQDDPSLPITSIWEA